MKPLRRILNPEIVSGLFLIFLGAMTIVGWILRIQEFTQPVANFAPMQFNTALCFILSGLAILFLSSSLRLIFAGIVFLCSFSTILEYLLKLDFGIDRLFVAPYIVTKTEFPGRMALHTAISFTLVSLTLIFLKKRISGKRIFLFNIFTGIILSIALINLAGYLTGIESLLGAYEINQMAVHTALGFTLISLVFVWLMKRDYSEVYYSAGTLIASIGLPFFSFAFPKSSQCQ